MLNTIKQLAQQIHPEAISIRRHLHQHPELSFLETETAKFIQQKLTEMDIPFRANVAGNGIVATLEGKEKGKVIALRADMDALPITELNANEYKSQNVGVMHACGHDAHTASLLGTAYILKALKNEWKGTIQLFFQPAEEVAPGGASLMIKEGALKNPDVQSILGQHVQPYMDCGKVGLRGGKYMASADEIYIKIIGKGGHGAQPQMCIDSILIAANMLVQLQTVISRNADPRSPSLLTFGKIIGEGATNVIPNEVYLEGTFRAMDETWRYKAHERILAIAEGVAENMGGKAEVEIRKGYPVLFNDETLTAQTRENMMAYMGAENVIDLDLWMASEDFAYYTHEVPGCFYRLGTRNEAKGIVHGLHTPRFDIDEQALQISTGLMAWLAICELSQ
ncbi:MAG: M20 family metallopeptidase [Bacteroidia bacterium]